jgi:hypothetical protein
VQFAVVQATKGNRVLVADLAAERTWLSKANVVRFARRPTAYDAGLGREISAVLLVAKPDRFGGDAKAVNNRLLQQNDEGLAVLAVARPHAIILCGIYLPLGDC